MRSIWLRAVVLRRAVDSGVRICSLHFRPEDFEQHLHVSQSLGKNMKFPRLRKDAIPSLSLRKEPTPQHLPFSRREVAERELKLVCERGVVVHFFQVFFTDRRALERTTGTTLSVH
ncbi:hypothetical protein ISCGN_001419 [Ixodes scapularis]